jgi:hypothetical protein
MQGCCVEVYTSSIRGNRDGKEMRMLRNRLTPRTFIGALILGGVSSLEGWYRGLLGTPPGLTSAVVGLVAGAIWGAAIAHDPPNNWRAKLVSSAVGAGIGFFVGVLTNPVSSSADHHRHHRSGLGCDGGADAHQGFHLCPARHDFERDRLRGPSRTVGRRVSQG